MEELFDYIKQLDEVNTHLKYHPDAHMILPEREELIYMLNLYLKQAEVEYHDLLREVSI